MTTTLTQASYEFMKRPDDERFTSLTELHAFTQKQHSQSRQAVVSSKKLTFRSTQDKKGLLLVGNHDEANPTHWSFGQCSTLAGVPAKLLRAQCEAGLAPLAADNLNAGYKVIRDVAEVGMLVRKEEIEIPYDTYDTPAYFDEITLAAVTGPNYGRIWNSDITKALVNRFGDGVKDTDWTVPGFFGVKLDAITKANTTLFASDRDMFVFLADEKNRIELPNRRNGEKGSLARGFFVWNSEVGNKSAGIAFFLFDYSCCNRIVWGVEEFQRIAVRHTVTAPERWIEEIHPTLLAYGRASALPIEARLEAAQKQRINNAEEFLLKRNFTDAQAASIMATHMSEEERPIETLWDATTAITAYAKTIPHTDERVRVETMGGKLLDLAKIETNDKMLGEMFS